MSYLSVYYNRNNKRYTIRDDEGFHTFDYEPTLYKADENGTMYALDGTKVSPFKPSQYKFDINDPNIYEKDISKELLILRDLYYQNDDLPKNHRIVYLDIEIEMGDTLTPEYIQKAPMPITSIALIDTRTKHKYCLLVGDVERIEQEDITIIPCSSEINLMMTFLTLWEELDPTIVVGYNSDFFDIPYLFFRLKNKVRNQAYRLSPLKEVNINGYHVSLAGINCLDYYLLFKKFITKEEPSYKLGDIGTKYVNLGKIEYKGNLNDLYKNDLETFIQYNLRDVEIIEALENKQKFIQLTILISHLCHTPYESIYYNTVLNEGAILTYLKRKGIVSINKPTTQNSSIKEINIGDLVTNNRGYTAFEGILINVDSDKMAHVQTKSGNIKIIPFKQIRKKESYAGGYLKEPIPGLYSLSNDLDFTSLYPSIIKSSNIGIETLVGKIKTKDNFEQNLSLEKLKERNPEEKLVLLKLDKKRYTLSEHNVSVKKLINVIESEKLTISASGGIYRTDVKSIVCEVLEDWFEKREYYRGLKKKAGKEKKWEDWAFYDLYQLSFKILQNALYGTFAINGWRFTDGHKICSSSITNNGQRLTQESIKFINNKFNTEMNTDKDYVIASDTDSLFIELSQLCKHRYPELDLSYSNKIERNKYLFTLINEIQSEANANLNNICRSLFNINGKHYYELKQEVILEGAYWAGKRRYAMFVTNKEGVDIEEWDFKGLDLMKSNFPPLFRDFSKKMLQDIILGKPKSNIDKNILEFKKISKNIEWKSLLKPTGLKNLQNYIASPPTPSNVFSKLVKKCPANTKAAIYYNDFLKFMEIDKKYPRIQVGDKIYVAYLKNNPYSIDCMAFKGYEDPPEVIDLIEKYIDRDLLFDSVMKNKIEKVYKDIGWSSPVFNENVNKFFSF